MTGVVVSVVVLLLSIAVTVTAATQAVFRLGASRVRTLADEGFSGSTALVQIRSNPGSLRYGLRLISALLVLAAMGIGVLGATEAWGAMSATVVVLISAVVVFIVADALPRGLASRHPVRIALAAAPIILSVSRLVAALGVPFQLLENSSGWGGEHSAEERELREIQELGRQEGMLDAEENLLVERAFRLDEATAWDVMTPRVEIFAWRESTTIGEILGDLPSVPYSRVPVYAESVDDITGIVYVREAYRAFIASGGEQTLLSIARDPFFVPGSLSLAQLLQDFQTRRIHMGIVADEFGGTDGLITLEDVLEELVGEIVDETDLEEQLIVHVSADQVIVDAGKDLRDINLALGVALPNSDHRSLNGFILDELGHVPAKGERMERSGVQIEIVESSDTQVTRAKLTRLSDITIDTSNPD